MTEEELESLKKHVAGQTVRHASPFDNLLSYKNTDELSQDFINEWIAPYYGKLHRHDKETTDKFVAVKQKITDDVILKALGDFNWRTRQTGAYFAGITDKQEFIEIIGTHLLKSEVTFACKIYLVVLAYFNNQKCIDYIETYLNYYLNQPDLFFDQREAMEAISYLDRINKTNLSSKYNDTWLKFLENKPYWDKAIDIDHFEIQVQTIDKIKKYAC
jgi:hypothetical protein